MKIRQIQITILAKALNNIKSIFMVERKDYKTITDKIQPEIENVETGVYILNKIKVGESYTITHLEDKEPKIEKNEK